MGSNPVYRIMARCVTCRRWWSVPEPRGEKIADACACGGELEAVDMVEHLKTIPVATKETK